MSDGPRNEKARQRYRELKREERECVPVPVAVVVSEASSINLPRTEFSEENHFNWTVYGKTQADVEYQKLKHQASVEEYTVFRKDESPRIQREKSNISSPQQILTGRTRGDVELHRLKQRQQASVDENRFSRKEMSPRIHRDLASPRPQHPIQITKEQTDQRPAGPRNERARARHRQQRKEECRCSSVPASAVPSPASSLQVVRQEYNEDNHFGWTVTGRDRADSEYNKLKHQASVEPMKERRQEDRISTRPQRASYSRRHESIDQGPVGPRNNVARQRHRQRKKEECRCSSVPASAIPSDASNLYLPRQEFNEDNHYGWAVFARAHGDPEFEHLMKFHENPDDSGETFRRKTYVLYLADGTEVDRDLNMNMKATQTSLPPNENIVTEPQKKKRVSKSRKSSRDAPSDKKNELEKKDSTERLSEDKGKKKKSSSIKSSKKIKSKQKVSRSSSKHPPPLTSETEESKHELPEDKKEAGDVSQGKVDGKNKKKADKKIKKIGPIRWSLRAGADGSKKSLLGGERLKVLQTFTGIMKNKSKGIDSVASSDAPSSVGVPSEYLLDTPSGNNEYLYVSRKCNK